MATELLQIEVPGRLNLEQGKLYRLKLTDIPNRPGVEQFPTIEIPIADSTAGVFVTRNAIPIEFTDADFDHVTDHTIVSKVIYLKAQAKGQKPGNRQGSTATIASYDEPDRDIIEEAARRGTILTVVRMGNSDLVAVEPGNDREKVGRAGAPVKVRIGDDGIQGRVLPLDKENAKVKDDRVDQLLRQLEVITRDVATVQAENATLRQRLQKTELEVRALQTLLERKEREKAKTADRK
jgi:hypothetical protein